MTHTTCQSGFRNFAKNDFHFSDRSCSAELKKCQRPETIGPSNKYIFRVGVDDILILLTV
jgi:hypothetical protein